MLLLLSIYEKLIGNFLILTLVYLEGDSKNKRNYWLIVSNQTRSIIQACVRLFTKKENKLINLKKLYKKK